MEYQEALDAAKAAAANNHTTVYVYLTSAGYDYAIAASDRDESYASRYTEVAHVLRDGRVVEG
jgi:hypothetical protein